MRMEIIATLVQAARRSEHNMSRVWSMPNTGRNTSESPDHDLRFIAHSGQSCTPQYLETVLGLFWRNATSFSVQASLSRRLMVHNRRSFELCCRDACSAYTATVPNGATHVALRSARKSALTYGDPRSASRHFVSHHLRSIPSKHICVWEFAACIYKPVMIGPVCVYTIGLSGLCCIL